VTRLDPKPPDEDRMSSGSFEILKLEVELSGLFSVSALCSST
jgi:hypothetical protein